MLGGKRFWNSSVQRGKRHGFATALSVNERRKKGRVQCYVQTSWHRRGGVRVGSYFYTGHHLSQKEWGPGFPLREHKGRKKKRKLVEHTRKNSERGRVPCRSLIKRQGLKKYNNVVLRSLFGRGARTKRGSVTRWGKTKRGEVPLR